MIGAWKLTFFLLQGNGSSGLAGNSDPERSRQIKCLGFTADPSRLVFFGGVYHLPPWKSSAGHGNLIIHPASWSWDGWYQTPVGFFF